MLIVAACAINAWTTGLKRLKTASKACSKTHRRPANSPLRIAATLKHETTAPVHNLIPQTKPISRQSVCSAPASQSGLRGKLWRGAILEIRERRCLSRRRVRRYPQCCPSPKLPAQRAAVRLAGALRTLWRKATLHHRRSIGLTASITPYCINVSTSSARTDGGLNQLPYRPLPSLAWPLPFTHPQTPPPPQAANGC